MLTFAHWGTKIYRAENPREARRLAVFVARACFHRARMRELLGFFAADGERRRLLEANPYPLEQATRAFFYYRSTMAERIALIEEHVSFLLERLKIAAVQAIYAGQPALLWEDTGRDVPLRLFLMFEPGQRKEGMLSLVLRRGDEKLYQMMLWLAKDKEGAWALWIGAMQGPNADHARELVKQATKECHGCRTKNLILHATRAFAAALGIRRLYAVSNYGYYANNHVRRNRKLKTDFGAFWQEAGGEMTEDARFYALPLAEARKSMAEVPTRKRAVYRRRFLLLDAMEAAIGDAAGQLMAGRG